MVYKHSEVYLRGLRGSVVFGVLVQALLVKCRSFTRLQECLSHTLVVSN